ncbi:hypothetical protein GPAL_2963 [Glaciecola pallidula DSM 14239 = ACAM 615]|uniref:Uncharacterized protein n=2 Tax=Brumicola TaxID=3160924 RepID=K6YAR8_9ALTE|nr:hypothetical protein GPAL_2963 [Glaciecola pallidula DSM 14239 = ACAM 615]
MVMAMSMVMSSGAAYAQSSNQSIMKTSTAHSLAPPVITASGLYIRENHFFNAVVDALH